MEGKKLNIFHKANGIVDSVFIYFVYEERMR